MGRESVDAIRRRLHACAAAELPALLGELSLDERAGVARLIAASRARLAREEAETARLRALASVQRELHARGVVVVAGVDEVGRGALAGPVTACAVVLSVGTLIPGLDDSKRLAPARRTTLAAMVRETAEAVCVAHASPAEIDSFGIGPATRLAMTRAVEGLALTADHVLVDGNDARIGRPATAVVGGDRKCACIAAASIVAKVERDALMVGLADRYPGFDLDVNKGYGTREHIDAIGVAGPSEIHRLSFAPCCGRQSLF